MLWPTRRLAHQRAQYFSGMTACVEAHHRTGNSRRSATIEYGLIAAGIAMAFDRAVQDIRITLQATFAPLNNAFH